MRLLIIGNRGGTNVGACLERAAIASELDVRLLEARDAMRAPSWLRRFNWYFRGHRPTRLGAFSEAVWRVCEEFHPDVLLTTGLSPVNRVALARIRAHGVRAVNYLTDDPWNPALYAPWFMEALREYDFVFSPRRANIPDLQTIGCGNVRYLPFAYDPCLHFVEQVDPRCTEYDADVLFVGGADRDRVPYCNAIIEAGLKLSVYGDYWRRHLKRTSCFRGYADLRTLRVATAGARICLCLVRRSNRDGHVMRSFEATAMGGCMLTEDTPEHRDIFGSDGEAVVYFRTIPEMVDRAIWLLENKAERERLAGAARAVTIQRPNTYADRLRTMLEAAALSKELTAN